MRSGAQPACPKIHHLLQLVCPILHNFVNYQTCFGDVKTISWWCIFFRYYQKTILCRVSQAHSKIYQTHNKDFCRAAHEQRTPQQRFFAVRMATNSRQSLCHVLHIATQQSKVAHIASDNASWWAQSVVWCESTRKKTIFWVMYTFRRAPLFGALLYIIYYI
jgi:hypothetical protein